MLQVLSRVSFQKTVLSQHGGHWRREPRALSDLTAPEFRAKTQAIRTKHCISIYQGILVYRVLAYRFARHPSPAFNQHAANAEAPKLPLQIVKAQPAGVAAIIDATAPRRAWRDAARELIAEPGPHDRVVIHHQDTVVTTRVETPPPLPPQPSSQQGARIGPGPGTVGASVTFRF